jgi:Protein of unknown function (DUF3383)/PEP-CTERM motif
MELKMGYARAFPLIAASLVGSVSLAGYANAQSDPYALDRLFLTSNDWVPLGEVISFSSATAVANYFGANSNPAALATEFYDGYNSSDGPANMLFARLPALPARAHLYGAYIPDPKLANIQKIAGPIAITSEGYNYSGSINLSGATTFKDAAADIRNALNKNLPIAAQTTGSSIAPVSVSFQGSISYGTLTVTSVSSGSIQIGSYISGTGIPSGAQITSQISGTPNGAGKYGLFVREGTISSEPMMDNYGVLTVGSVSSGTVAIGQQVTNGSRGSGNNIAQHTAIEDNISGSGAGSKWVVDLTQNVAGENMEMTGAPLSVAYRAVKGATGNSGYFFIQQWPSFNFSSSTLSYATSATGSAATLLGLAEGSGFGDSGPGSVAYLSSPGLVVQPGSAFCPVQDCVSDATFMADLISAENNQWSTFQTTYSPKAATPPGEQAALQAWAESTNGQYTYLQGWSSKTPPIVDSLPPSAVSALALSPAAVVPEPSTWAMAFLGFAGLSLARKWRMRTSVPYWWVGLSKRAS